MNKVVVGAQWGDEGKAKITDLLAQDADLIIVMDNGTINGMGTHEELLKNNNIYKEIYDMQNKIGGGAQNA